MSAAVHADFREFAPLQAKIDKLVGLYGDELRDGIGAILETGARRRIAETKAGPDGVPWVPWTPVYANKRPTGKSLLQDSGGMLDSIQFETSTDTITVFAATEYAPAHQFGFDGLVTVPTHNRRIEQAFGKPLPFPVITTVKEHQARRRLPARPYLGMSAEEVDEIEALVDNLAAEALP